MEKGEFDLYPEYTSSGWILVLGHKAGEVSDDKMLAKLQEEYEEKFDMTWVGLYGQNNTYAGITGVGEEVVAAAEGMGSTRFQIMTKIKLPLAAGVIIAGVRNMVVMTISVSAIASFIGAGGLGVAIYRGITIYDSAMTFCGSFLIALLAIVSDLLLGLLERKVKKKTGIKNR